MFIRVGGHNIFNDTRVPWNELNSKDHPGFNGAGSDGYGSFTNIGPCVPLALALSLVSVFFAVTCLKCLSARKRHGEKARKMARRVSRVMRNSRVGSQLEISMAKLAALRPSITGGATTSNLAVPLFFKGKRASCSEF